VRLRTGWVAACLLAVAAILAPPSSGSAASNHPDRNDPTPPPFAGNQVGFSVDVSGSLAVVGAPGMAKDAGTAYVYEKSGGQWVKEATLPDPRKAPKNAHDFYAWAVAISSSKSGNYVAVGGNDANGEADLVYIYKGSGKSWKLTQTIHDLGGVSTDMFGDALAISDDTLVVSATCVNGNSGTMYVYLRFSQKWNLDATIPDPAGQPNDFFGQSVSISGNQILVGATNAAYVYISTSQGHWSQAKTFPNPGSANDNFGFGVALAGTKAVIGAPGGIPGQEISSPLSPGAAYVFTGSGPDWSSTPKTLTAPFGVTGDEFGRSVTITGNSILIGMPNEGMASCGSAFAFDLSGLLPDGAVQDPACAKNDQFGFSVAAAAATAGIGAPTANKDKGATFFVALPPAAKPEAVLNHKDRSIAAVAISPSSQTVAVGDINGNTDLWNAKKHTFTAVLRNPNKQPVFGVAFSPDGRTLAVGTINAKFTSGVIYLWSLATHKVIATLHDPNTRGVDDVAFSPNGSVLAAADDNGASFLWNTKSHKLISMLQDPGGQDANVVRFSPDGKMVAVADNNGHAYLWNATTHHLIATITPPASPPPANTFVNSVAFSPDGHTLAVADGDGHAYRWNVNTRKLSAPLRNPAGQGVQGVVYSPNGRVLAATTTDLKTEQSGIILWDARSGEILAQYHDPGSAGNFRLAYRPDGDAVAVGDANGSTYLWNTAWLK
jgi:WD40 repeat protein